MRTSPLPNVPVAGVKLALVAVVPEFEAGVEVKVIVLSLRRPVTSACAFWVEPAHPANSLVSFDWVCVQPLALPSDIAITKAKLDSLKDRCILNTSGKH